MAELDHLVYGCRDLADGTNLIAELAGATAVVGGPHVGRGTHNTLLTFDDRTYFEIIGIDPDQPEPSQPRGFGLDHLVRPGLVGYAIHPTGDETLDDLAAAIRAVGLDPGTRLSMSRLKPDGELLEWELTAGGDTANALDGALPFAIDWLGKPSPATTLPSMGTLRKLSVRHPDQRVGDAIEALGLAGAIDFTQGPPQLSATVDTRLGTIHLH